MTPDREWTEAERDALRELGEGAAPPDDLEDRIVEAAAAHGLIDRRGADARPTDGRPIGTWWRGVAAVAAAVLVFVVGAFVGSWLSGPDTPNGPRYALLLYEGPEFDGSGDVAAEYTTWALRMRDLGRAVDGEELAAEARVEGAEPAGESDRRLTGYFVIEARDLDQAEAIAATHPHVGRGGTIVVRPIVER